MPDWLVATAAVIVFVSVSCFVVRRKKDDALARIQAEPDAVSRLYLRADADLDVFWLHAELENGRRLLIAAPWAIDDMLPRLEAIGLRLDPQDKAALDALHKRWEASAKADRQTAFPA